MDVNVRLATADDVGAIVARGIRRVVGEPRQVELPETPPGSFIAAA